MKYADLDTLYAKFDDLREAAQELIKVTQVRLNR